MPKVIIVGGGISGLALANLLELDGTDFIVLEARSAVAPDEGAIIGLGPNSARVFDRIGCIEGLSAGAPFDKSILRGLDGAPLRVYERVVDFFTERFGYPVHLIERRHILQALYDNLTDKNKVRLSEKVIQVEQSESTVTVNTERSTYSGSIVIGADGTYSRVRSQMFRSAPNVNPCALSGLEGRSSCDFVCLFGVSPSRSEFGPGTNTIVFKRNHSYLMLGGARGRMSWCLWHRLDRRRYLDADDVRFSKSDELAIAQRYWNDDVAETVTFGELYQSRITSTLSACMEHVFPRWYDGRIMMIGDAAHKLDPTSGQGANAAIETAAALAAGLRQAKFASEPITSHGCSKIFADVQARRMAKVKWLLEDSTKQQQLKSMVTRPLEEVALRKIPKLPMERAFSGYINALDPDVTSAADVERGAGSKL